MKKGGLGVNLFSDEKRFMVDRVINKRNDQYTDLGEAPMPESVKLSAKTNYPQGIVVLEVIHSDGKACPLPPSPEGLKVNAALHQRLLKKNALPWVVSNYSNKVVVFQQDGAPPRTAKSTQAVLAQPISFWDKSLGAPSSLDLNPLDFFW